MLRGRIVAAVVVALVLAFSGSVIALHKNPKSTYVSHYVAAQGIHQVWPSIAFLGDSYTSGSAEGGGTSHGFPFMLADRLRYNEQVFAVGGSGYVNGQKTDEAFGNRVNAVIAYKPNVIVVFGSRNDTHYPEQQVEAAASDTLGRLKAGAPKADILVIGPAWFSKYPPDGSPGDATVAVRAAAQSLGLAFVDPMSSGWFSGDNNKYVGADHVHPNDEGHRALTNLIGGELHRLGWDHLTVPQQLTTS